MGALLENVLHIDTLRTAFDRVQANGGKAGSDNITLTRFGRHRDAHLFALIDDVRRDSYVMGAPRQIPVRMGNKHRVLSILRVRDRVLQRAVLDVLAPHLDRDFQSCSFGYRPGLSLDDAVQRITELRDAGLVWVLDADIANCFGSIDHDQLLSMVTRAVPDEELVHLIRIWVCQASRGRPRGILLGAPLSPLLCNLFLDQLDRGLLRRGHQIVRYADDFVVCCRNESQARRAAHDTEKLLRGLGLSLNPAKTGLATFEGGFSFLGVWFEGDEINYNVEGKRIVMRALPPRFFRIYGEGYQ